MPVNMDIKLEHNHISFTTTKWNNNNFTHYGFHVLNGVLTCTFVEEIIANGKNGNLWKRNEIHSDIRNTVPPPIPADVMERVSFWYKGYLLQNVNLQNGNKNI